MLYSRQQAINAINEKYGLNIGVDLSNVWKQKEQEIKTTIADLQDKEENNDSKTTETTETENKTDSETKQG